MGRTGRRGGAANCTFLATKEPSVVQAAAILTLFREGFVEPVRPSPRAYHILAHQLMSLADQHGGLAADRQAETRAARPLRQEIWSSMNANGDDLHRHEQRGRILLDHR
jgi:Lhr-like helicase